MSFFTEDSLYKAAEVYADALKDPTRAVNVVDSIELPAIFAPVERDAEKAARATHEEWLRDAAARGVTFETNPNFVPYDELSEETKAANVAVALRTYRIFCHMGMEFSYNHVAVNEEKLGKVITASTEVIHDGWSKDKFANGWTFATVRDNAQKKHTDLLDLATLVAVWPGKDEWDRNAVRGALDGLGKNYGIYPVI